MIHVCVCVYVFVCVCVPLQAGDICVGMCVREHTCVCLSVCVCVRERVSQCVKFSDCLTRVCYVGFFFCLCMWRGGSQYCI